MPPRLVKSLASRGASSSTRGRKRGRRAPSPPPPPFDPPFPWPTRDIAQLDRCQALCKRSLVPTRYVDDYTMNHLGIRREIHQFFDTVGWTYLASLQYPTYEETTFEFLSSLNSSYNSFNDLEEQCVHFRLMGDEYHISLTEFNAIFRLPNRGTTWFPPHFKFHEAWNRLSSDGSQYNPSATKSTKLQSLTLRYIHRFIVHALRGKGESTGVVGRPELFLLDSLSSGLPVNTGAWMLKHFISVSKRPTGKICIGGLITAIYIHYGYHVDPDELTVISGPNKIDMTTLGKMGMVRYTGGGQYVFVDAAGRPIQADEADEEEDEEGNLEADPDAATEDEAEDVPQPTHAPASSQAAEQSSSSQPPWELILAQLERLNTHTQETNVQLESLHNQTRENTATLGRMEDRLSRMDERMSRFERRSPHE